MQLPRDHLLDGRPVHQCLRKLWWCTEGIAFDSAKWPSSGRRSVAPDHDVCAEQLDSGHRNLAGVVGSESRGEAGGGVR